MSYAPSDRRLLVAIVRFAGERVGAHYGDERGENPKQEHVSNLHVGGASASRDVKRGAA